MLQGGPVSLVYCEEMACCSVVFDTVVCKGGAFTARSIVHIVFAVVVSDDVRDASSAGDLAGTAAYGSFNIAGAITETTTSYG